MLGNNSGDPLKTTKKRLRILELLLLIYAIDLTEAIMSDLTFGQLAGLGGLSAAGNLAGSLINMGFQNKWNKIQMEREDNAIQRRMADLKASGINPLLAGQIGGASAGGYSAPSFDTNFVSKGIEAAMSGQQLKSMRLQNELMETEIAKANEQLEQWKTKGLPEYSTIGKTIQDLAGLWKKSGDGNSGIPFFDIGVKSTQELLEALKGLLNGSPTPDPTPEPTVQPGSSKNPILNWLQQKSDEASSVQKKGEPWRLSTTKEGNKRFNTFKEKLWKEGFVNLGAISFKKVGLGKFEIFVNGTSQGTSTDLIGTLKKYGIKFN